MTRGKRKIINKKEMNEELGNVIRYLRKKEGMTQKELAFRSGLTRTSITNIELGNQTPSPIVLKDIADALGYNIKLQFRRKQ